MMQARDNNCREPEMGTSLVSWKRKRRPGEGVVEGARPLRMTLAHGRPCRLEKEVRILHKYKFSINYCSRFSAIFQALFQNIQHETLAKKNVRNSTQLRVPPS